MGKSLVLLLALIASTAALSCSTEEVPQPGEETRPERTEAAALEDTTVPHETTVAREPASPTVAVGEKANLGDVSVRVFGVRTGRTAHYYPGPDASPLSQKASGEYVMVDYVAENGSDSTLETEPEATLEDDEGDSHEPDASIEPPTNDADGAEIGAGESVASTLFFDVPGGTAPDTLELSLSGEEARVDLTNEEREEIPPSDYLQVYHLWFNERAYEEIYGMIEPSSTQGITLGEWLDYFEPLWGEWYLGLDSLDRVSGGDDYVAYDMTRTFYESGGVETPNTVTQEMVRDGDEWKLILRDDQANDILAAQAPAPEETVAEETTSVPETTAPEETVSEGDLYDCADFSTQAEAQAVLESDLTDPYGLDEDGDLEACEELAADEQYVPPESSFDRERGDRFAPRTPSPTRSPYGEDLDCNDVDGPMQTPAGDPNDLDRDDDGTACG